MNRNRLVDDLPELQRNFCLEYVGECNYNATKAYKAAGYEGEGAAQSASALLRNPKIQAAIQELEDEMLKRYDAQHARIIRETAAIAFADPADYFDEHGELLPIKDLSRNARAALKEMDISETDFDGIKTTNSKLKGWDKLRALEMLGRRAKLFTEEAGDREVSVNVTIEGTSSNGHSNGHK